MVESKIKLMLIIVYLFYILTFFHVNGDGKKHFIYMLMWTTPDVLPFPSIEMEQSYFVNRKCQYQNCFVTNNKSYFNDIRQFDVLLFNVMNINSTYDILPPLRSEKQKYVFWSRESPDYFSITKHYDGFFNLTWTYKLDSDITWRYFVIRNKKGEVIGPKIDMNWKDIKDMKPTSERIKSKLKEKNIAAAWIVSHCETTSHRETFYRDLKNELTKFDLKIDVYGDCGEMFTYPLPYNLECDRDKMDECYALLETNYYFYLAFENSKCEDYVTEKVLTALRHFAVPVVYGGANYTRFLPIGSYLNAKILGPTKLAKIMNDTIYDKEKYYEFFKWHRYYSFHEPSDNADADEICAFCAYLNDKSRMRTKSVYTRINNFWHVDDTLQPISTTSTIFRDIIM